MNINRNIWMWKYIYVYNEVEIVRIKKDVG